MSDRGGRLAIWRCELQAQRVSQLARPEAGASDYGPGAPGRDPSDFLFFRTEPGSKTPHVWSARVGQADGAVVLGTQMGNQPWFVPGTNAFVFHSDRDGADAVYRQSAKPAATAERFGAADTGTSYTTPFPSPDGHRIAFARCVDGVNQLHVMRADGSRLQQLTFGDEASMFPAWSPLGDRIVHVRGEPTAKRPTGRLTVLTLARN